MLLAPLVALTIGERCSTAPSAPSNNLKRACARGAVITGWGTAVTGALGGFAAGLLGAPLTAGISVVEGAALGFLLRAGTGAVGGCVGGILERAIPE